RCAEALAGNYGVGSDRCFVTLAPQDLDTWTPAGRNFSSPLRLLFVGNDFLRKGGDFLLHLYEQHLAGACRLTIASNDAVLEIRRLPAGVEWLRGRNREQLLDIYQQSHLCVFPSKQDFMPHALCEAVATGLPCAASDVGSVRDIVRDGETGWLMPRDATPAQWAAKLLDCAARPDELARLSPGARQFAEEKLGMPRFENLIREIVERLRKCPLRRSGLFRAQIAADGKLSGSRPAIIEILECRLKDLSAIGPVQFDTDVPHFGQPSRRAAAENLYFAPFNVHFEQIDLLFPGQFQKARDIPGLDGCFVAVAVA